MNRVFGEVLRQHTRTERITDTANETFVTLRLNGKGAVKRNIGEGKNPQPFSGYRVRSGQFIYSRIDARNGAFAIIPPSLDGAVVSKDFPVFDIEKTVADPRFLLLSVSNESFVDRIRRLSFGATNRQRVKEEVFLSLQLELPPLEEQRRIAAILDKADELRTKRRQALAHLDTLTQSIFHSMFGGNKELQPVIPLSEAVARGTVVTYGIVQAGEEFPGGVPYIRTGDMTGGVIATEKLRRTDPKIAAKFARSRVSAGDIVMSIRATVGTVALTPEKLEGANLTQGTARIAPGSDLTSEYLLEFLRDDATQRWIWRNVKGATFKEITLERLRQLPVVVPPLGLQKAFATRVAAVERLKESHRKHLAELDALFASLQHRAFKGEL